MSAPRWRAAICTLLALIGFAANSLLCRSALGNGLIDAATFTLVRVASGALALALLVQATVPGGARRGGSFVSAAALFGYAIAFSLAYMRIHAGIGALVLFASVQITMIGGALLRHERPSRLEWIGLAIAAAGLVALKLPGLDVPDTNGVVLMAAAGAAWGVYSLRGGRGAHSAASPTVATAGNFARAVPLAVGASALWLLLGRSVHLTRDGTVLAVTSGAVTSGLGYSFWYAALPTLGATRAAIVQLTVPVLAALGGVVFLREPLTTRLLLTGAAIVGGVALAVLGRSARVAARAR
jgi:drug/metabolite transporter (DMT)-like permease